MYTDLGERGLILWGLDYSMKWIIDIFRAIPDELLSKQPAKGVPSPGWTFGHIIVAERAHIGRVLQHVNDIPSAYDVFYGCQYPVAATEEQVRAAIRSKDDLISYWKEVRGKTASYLASITDQDLKKIPDPRTAEGDPNRNNAIREWLLMTLQHQNHNWGRLATVKALIENT
jgi:uncharacterized damage-inducible protein DinB